MTEHPILFKPRLVQAILEGRKTQTRRIVKPQPPSVEAVRARSGSGFHLADSGAWAGVGGTPGDLLWVRETWRVHEIWDNSPPREVCSNADVWYGASGTPPVGYGKARPSIFMPRWACRLWLRVTDIRAERLQEITEEDARAEGAPPRPNDLAVAFGPHLAGFVELWDSVNARRGFGWGANPWVWVVTFERAEAPHD